MQLIEEHAYHTYDNFLQEQGEFLKTQPAPEVAISYYRDGDLYLFDEFQTSHPGEERRPKIENLYDVFVAIRDDELEHVKTMIACQKPNAQETFQSPHNAKRPAMLEPTKGSIESHSADIGQGAVEREPVEMS
jgi:ubiquinol oxidase